MPMLDIQRRHAEVFRIRLGDKDDRGNMRKLTDAIRITSPNRSVVQAFADVFGGDVSEWEQQWQVYVPTTELPVLVLPGQSITQWWEQYRGSVCERRCDGYTETLSGSACKCPAEITERLATKNACRPMTRINVVCPDVEVVGAGSLVTHGMIAAETLPQAVAIAEGALSRGLMVPAVLRVVQHIGKAKQYIVPQLEIFGISLNELTTGEVARPAAVAAAPEPKGLPVAAHTRPPEAAVVKDTKPLPAPANRARPALPHEAKNEDAHAARDLQTLRSHLTAATGWLGDTQRKLLAKEWEKAKLPKIGDLDAEQAKVGAPLIRKWAALSVLAEAGFTNEKDRHKAVGEATGGTTESTKDLSAEQFKDVVGYCEALRSLQPTLGGDAA